MSDYEFTLFCVKICTLNERFMCIHNQVPLSIIIVNSGLLFSWSFLSSQYKAILHFNSDTRFRKSISYHDICLFWSNISPVWLIWNIIEHYYWWRTKNVANESKPVCPFCLLHQIHMNHKQKLTIAFNMLYNKVTIEV